MKTPLPFTNGFYLDPALPVSAQRLVNWYVGIKEVNALSQEVLYGTPGITQKLTTGLTSSVNRSGAPMNGVPYFLNGQNLYKINADFTATDVGDIPGQDRCWFADNGTQLMILRPGIAGYVCDGTTTSQIVDAGFTASGNPLAMIFVDGYFLAVTDQKKYIISAVNDGFTWNALDFGTAESDPDGLVAPIKYNNQPFLMGEVSGEAVQNTGNADFPFERLGIFLDKGVAAPFSLINIQGGFIFIGNGKNEAPAIWLYGGVIEKLSTVPIDKLLQDLTSEELESVYAWTYAQRGAYFIGFALPTTTIVYDTTAKRWHERQSYSSGEQRKYRVSCIVQAYNKVLCADVYDGRIGELDPDVTSEYGEIIVSEVVTQPFQNNMQGLTVPSLEWTMDGGTTLDPLEDPQISLETSRNNRIWNFRGMRSAGEIGQYDERPIWRRLGHFPRFASLRFRYSGTGKRTMIQLTADVRGMSK
jgi:hypothetical protein